MRISIAFYLMVFGSFLPLSLFAQNDSGEAPVILFPKTSYDFGKIEESVGPVIVDFEFTNRGTVDLYLKSVEASCGCTVPEWTADTIKGGETGIIKVSFDPTNRPGPFNKTVTVTSNAVTPVSVLTIEGMVIPRASDLKSQYSHKVGGLQFRSRNIHFGNITNEKVITKEVEAYNGTDKIIAFADSILAPPYVTVTFFPQAVNPGQVGLIKVAYDPVKMDELGYKSDNLTMFTFEPQDSVKQFNIFATVLEYFPPIPVDRLGSLPKVNVDKKIHDFGNTSPSEVLQTVFFIANEGKEPLVIKKIQSNCNCVSAKLDRNIVLPGQNARMVVDFEIPELALGTQQKDISIFTNDPANHVQVVTVKAYVRD